MAEMRIERTSTGPVGLMPPVYDVLLADLRVQIFNTNHRRQSKSKLRHPLGIYNVSFQGLVDGFGYVLDTLGELANEQRFRDPSHYGNDNWYTPLLIGQEQLLRLLMDHLDDCLCVLMCFFEPKEDYENNQYVNAFKRQLNRSQYVQQIRSIANHIKHHQGRLRLLILMTENDVFPGYFVEGVWEPNILGPAPQIHDDNTAFSFARDLRLHLWGVYLISELLRDALIGIIGESKIGALPTEADGKISGKLTGIIKRVSELPRVVFPDEVQKPVPVVEFTQDDSTSSSELILDLKDVPSGEFSRPSSGGKAFVSYTGDGVSREFKMPYLKT